MLVVAGLDVRPAFVISTIPVVDGFQTMRRCHGEVRFAKLNALLDEDRERRFKGEPSAYMGMSPKSHEVQELTSWPFPHVYAGFMAIQANEAPRHEHRNTIHSTELLLQYVVKPYAQRITDTPVMMTLAHADNITSADLEVETFNAIACPYKQFASIKGVDHMSLYTNRDHLGKVGRVQAQWLKGVLAGES